MDDTKQLIEHFREVKDDYAPVKGIFDEDSEKVRAIKEIIAHIGQIDRTIILLYADCQSFRALGKMLGVSHMTARKEVLRIRKDILARYEQRYKSR